MKEFLTVFKFELNQIIRKKSFIATAVIVGLVFFGLTFLPIILGLADSSEDTNVDGVISEIEKDDLAVLVKGNIHESVFETLSTRYNIKNVESEDEIKKLIDDKEISQGIVLESNTKAKVYGIGNGLVGIGNEIENMLKESYKYNIALPEAGIDSQEVINAENVQMEYQYEIVGRNGIAGYILSYFGIMFLYFMILLNGQTIATNVAKEKSSRTMELLITNVRPKSLIYGKVLAGVFGSIILIMVLLISLSFGFMINISSNPEISGFIKMILAEVGLKEILVFISFALIGVLMYYFIFAALGSLVSKVEELSQALTPIMTIVVIAFMIPMTGMSSPDSLLMKVASFIPFTSPLAMFSRFVMTTVSLGEVLISFLILSITTVLMGIVSVKIYRQGTLNYGNRLNIFKALTQKVE